MLNHNVCQRLQRFSKTTWQAPDQGTQIELTVPVCCVDKNGYCPSIQEQDNKDDGQSRKD